MVTQPTASGNGLFRGQRGVFAVAVALFLVVSLDIAARLTCVADAPNPVVTPPSGAETTEPLKPVSWAPESSPDVWKPEPTQRRVVAAPKPGPDGFASIWLSDGVHSKGETVIEQRRTSKPFKFHVYDIPEKYIDGALTLLTQRWEHSTCNRGCNKTNYTLLDSRHAHSLFTADVFMTRFLKFHPSHTSNPDEADVFIIPMMTHLYNCAGVMDYGIEILNWIIKEREVYYRRMDHRDHFLFWWRWGMHFGGTKKLWKRIATHLPNVNFISFDFLELQGRNYFQDFSLSLKPNFLRARDWIVVPYPDFSPTLRTPIPEDKVNDARSTFFYFAGTPNIGGIRRWIKRSCKDHPDLCVYADMGKSVIDTERLGIKVDYATAMKSALFCGHAAGDALSSRRPTSAVLAGCIPVLICDLCLYAWENIIDYSSFAVFVHEDDVMQGKLFDILKRIPKARIALMQQNLVAVRERFRYNTSGPPKRGDALDTLVDELALRGSLYRQYRRWYTVNSHLSSDPRDYPADPPLKKRYFPPGSATPEELSNPNGLPPAGHKPTCKKPT